MANEKSTDFMIASLQEAHNYLRDTSKRLSEHVQFYITIVTALLAGFFIIISQFSPRQIPFSVALICTILAGIGFITFIRLSSIKVQATIHFARSYKWSMYFLDKDKELYKYFAGEGMLQENDIRIRHFPFTKQIIFLLKAFALFNGFLLSLSLLFTSATFFLFTTGVIWQPKSFYLPTYGIIVIIGNFVLELWFSLTGKIKRRTE